MNKEPKLITAFYLMYAGQMQFYWTVCITWLLLWEFGWQWGGSVICLLLVPVSIMMTIGDYKSRMVEYRQIRKEMLETDYDSKTRTKWLKAQKFAACRRLSTGAAIRNIHEARSFYHALGYRWWHVFPDEFYKKMFSLTYWKKALMK